MAEDDDEGSGWAGAAWNAVTGAAGAVAEVAEHEVVGVGETVYHAGAGVYDAATGDWDGAANQAGDMANSALNVATFGAVGAAEAGWDAATAGERAAGASDSEAPTSDDARHGALRRAGEWIGDEVYDLVHGDDSDD
jgi:hypothetical protein